MKTKKLKEEKPAFQLGRDYYFDENGYMVMTREFHLRRGFCCKSGCKNCPYNKNIKLSPRFGEAGKTKNEK